MNGIRRISWFEFFWTICQFDPVSFIVTSYLISYVYLDARKSIYNIVKWINVFEFYVFVLPVDIQNYFIVADYVS